MPLRFEMKHEWKDSGPFDDAVVHYLLSWKVNV